MRADREPGPGPGPGPQITKTRARELLPGPTVIVIKRPWILRAGSAPHEGQPVNRPDDDLIVAFWEERDALFRFALKILRNRQEAEDIVHDAYLKLVSGGTNLGAIDHRRAWLFKIIRNLCIDRIRAERHRSDRGHHLDIAGTLHAEGMQNMTPERDVLSTERLRRAYDAMQRLPAEEAQTLTLAVVEGLSYDDIAYVTEVPVGTVRSRLNRARRMLRNLVDGEPVTPHAKRTAPGGCQ